MAFGNKKKSANYISAKESRAISRENRKITRRETENIFLNQNI